MSSPKLFLEFNDIDSLFHVNDQDGFAYGMGHDPVSAIKHARVVTDKPISIGEICELPTECVSEKPDGAIADHDVFIAALAEIAGMKVTRVFDDNMTFVGYTMEAI